MARFAADCMRKMPRYLRKMEIQFGPGTASLSLRIGIHSGPVTGGFLRGKGSRFQLFGDSMTTANLIQSHGMAGRIHLSEDTANLLQKAGKRRWVTEREEKIQTMEKGGTSACRQMFLEDCVVVASATHLLLCCRTPNVLADQRKQWRTRFK